ncbi:MAG: 7-carboxy-7-deazaguanine synthase QueE [Flavobacteriales bacterium]
MMTKPPTSLPVMEAFYTIQGEGRYSGSAAYFIRLAACDVGCPFCDVKESWESYPEQMQTIEDILLPIKQAEIAVITGGEPLLHQLDELCDRLHQKGIKRHIETSGSSPISGHWDWFTLSPKKRKMPLAESWKAADELKIIISRKNDFEFAEHCAKEVSASCQLYLQPEWDKTEDILPQLIDYVKEHPKWKISLQTHKFMDIP